MADHGESHGDYVHGKMDISEHVSTYEMFANLTKWGSLIVSAGLVFLVVLTCVKDAGFIPAAISAVVVLAVGWFILRKKPDTH
jgi:Bacterial aa3 type cytochrome c oxidase subunit IV